MQAERDGGGGGSNECNFQGEVVSLLCEWVYGVVELDCKYFFFLSFFTSEKILER